MYRRLFQPHHNLLSVPETQVSPLRDTPNSSPAHPHKHSLIEDYTDPLANKKPRISHLSSKTTNDKSGSKRSSKGRDAAKEGSTVTRVTKDNSRRNSLDPKKLFDSLSEVSKQKVEVAKRLEPAPSVPEDSKGSAPLPQSKSDRPPSPLEVPRLDRHSRMRRKSKHRDRNQVRGVGLETLSYWLCPVL